MPQQMAAETQAPGPRLFLNVEKSASGRCWQDRLPEEKSRLAIQIAQQHGLPELLARVLAARGVEAAGADAFLNPSLRHDMPDPYALQDMEAAALRIAAAVIAGERIAIFGDYDVDGATSSAMLCRYLRDLGLKARIYIPDRIFEGYGPNIPALEVLKGEGADLLICVDCGTQSFEPFAWAAEIGLDVVVLDHHQTGAELPCAAALVNPNRQDDLSGLGGLAAAGVTFLALVAVNRVLRERNWFAAARAEPDLMGLLDLAALGTVCDVVPLTGLNRVLAAQGLKVIARLANPGLRALAEVAGQTGAPTPYHLGFVLGPRINAGGRIGRADLGARLLAGEGEDLFDIAVTLHRLNAERQAIEAEVLEQAMAEADTGLGSRREDPCIVTAGQGWHPGVVGLVAARLKERFRRPALAIALDEQGRGSGSGRSIAGVDLGAAVRAAVDAGILARGGGHAMAAGLTVEKGRIGDLRAFLQDRLRDQVLASSEHDRLKIDGALSAASATQALVEQIARAGPFGMGNAEPVFAFPAHRLIYAEQAGRNHVRCTLAASDGSRLNAIAFRALDGELGKFLLEQRNQPIHAAGQLRIDRWGGTPRVQLHVLDAAKGSAG